MEVPEAAKTQLNNSRRTGATGNRTPESRIKILIASTITITAILVGARLVNGFDPDSGSASICGAPPPVSNDEVSGKIAAEAKSLGGILNSPKLSKEVSKKRTEIFSKYPNGERAIAFYQYQVCILLMNDKTMALSGKLDALKEIQKEEIRPKNGISRMYEYKVLNRKMNEGDVVVVSTFQRLDDEWVEIQNNVVAFEFSQYLNDGNYVYLKDKQRKISIMIPVNGGLSQISTDDGTTWRTWNQMWVK